MPDSLSRDVPEWGMEVLFVVALVVGVAILILKGIQAHRKQVTEAWDQAATQLGMRFTPGTFIRSKSIEGRLHDNRVRVDTFTRSSGKHSTTFTRYRIDFPRALGLGLNLKEQGFISGVAAFFGSQDIETGDPQFDPRVVVKGADPRHIARFLTPARRLRIVRLFQNHPGCEIKDHAIEWSRRGGVTETAQLVTTVRRLAFAAARLCSDSEADQSLDQALEARREGRLDDAAKVLERASRDDPEDEELGEWARETRDVGDGIPALPAPEAEVERSADEPAPPVPTPEPEPELPVVEPVSVEPLAPGDASDGLAVAAVCEDLFASDVMSFDARRRFNELYKDRIVRWSGELKRVDSFRSDMVFKGDSGTRMVLDVHEVAGSAFGRTAQAIVRLPTEALEGLRPRVGEQIAFEGRLLSCDALMRNLFVADGRLL